MEVNVIGSLFLAVMVILISYSIVYYSDIIKKKLEIKIDRYIMLFKWFIIGRYHCDLPKWAINTFVIVNKLFWGIIAFSLCFTIIVLGGLND